MAQLYVAEKCGDACALYLTEDEIKVIMTHEFENPSLAFVRDLFVFTCFTALSFVDMKELTTDEIIEVNGEKWIVGKRQ